MIGKTLGKYRVIDRLGRGGMGTVYKAVDETLDREVAIKVLNPDVGDTELLKRFRAEAVTLARLNHPGIATLFELTRQDDDLLMVMEFVRGETFHDLSERLGPVAPPQAAYLCMQVLDALAHAHRTGVVHRDLKPANLMVTENGSVKIMDFGIARVLGTEHYTHGGYMMGTPAYMSPEQVLGREVDGRADLYSVGVVLYRLLTGRLPFAADTAIAMVQKQIFDEPTPVSTIRPDLPAWCSEIMTRALAKSPERRFQSAEEFRRALLDAVQPQGLGELPTIATPAPPLMALDSDATFAPYGSRAVRTTRAGAAAAAVSTPPAQPIDVAVPSPATPSAATPTPAVAPLERTTGTTVVLGRTHLFVLAALFVVLAAGIAVLAFAVLRRGSLQQQLPLLGSQPAVSTDAPRPASQGEPTSMPTIPLPPTTPSSNPPRVAATAGGDRVQPPGTGIPVALDRRAPAGTVPPADAKAGNTEPSSEAEGALPPKSGPPPVQNAVTGTSSPGLVTFDDIRVLVTDAGNKGRERPGVLQLGGGRITVAQRGAGGQIVSLPYTSVLGMFYSRSKQPRWRDASGREIESRVDLGRLGFFRGDRNWLIILTKKDPVIIRLSGDNLRTVLPAIQERTGIPVRR